GASAHGAPPVGRHAHDPAGGGRREPAAPGAGLYPQRTRPPFDVVAEISVRCLAFIVPGSGGAGAEQDEVSWQRSVTRFGKSRGQKNPAGRPNARGGRGGGRRSAAAGLWRGDHRTEDVERL